MAKIFYWMGDNRSGVEQIGYVYAMMLRQLGHQVDVYVTQDVKQQIALTNKALDADIVVFNETHPEIYNRIRSSPTQPTYNFVHGTPQKAPLWVSHLCLNYILASEHNPNGQILFPITYPFFKSHKPLHAVEFPVLFVGRFNNHKFIPKIREKFKQNRGLELTGVISGDPIDSADEELFTEVYYNLSIKQVHEYMLRAGVVIVPSKTECLSLVAGEALALGVPVLALEQNVPHVFDQFKGVISTVDDSSAFVDALPKIIENRNNQNSYWMQTYFCYERAKAMLAPFFGREKVERGSLTIHTNMHKTVFLKRPEYTNAKYITSEDNDHDVAFI